MPQINRTRGAKGILGSLRSHSNEKEHNSNPKLSDDEEPRRSSTSMDVLRSLGRDKKKNASLEDVRLRQGKLSIAIESPPLVSYGKPEQSTGALMSGQLKLSLTEPLELETFTLELIARVKYLKPVGKDCSDCAVRETELKKWTMIKAPRKFETGEHSTPFSYLLPGHLPASTSCALAKIEYILKATATTKTSEKMISYNTLELKRALMPPELPRHATRAFPPTTIQTQITFPLMIHPDGTFNIFIEMTGIVGKVPTAPGGDLMQRWRLKKLMWSVEEHSKAISPACTKHSQKLGGSGRGMEHESDKVIGEGELKEGWKLDWGAGESGNCAVEFQCSLNPAKKSTCDVKEPSGIEVKHRVMLEMIIFEEIATNKKMTSWSNSGNARVLRFSFQVLLTERAGEGVAWDEELPPLYEDVPRSPPQYATKSLAICESRDIPDISALGLDITIPEDENPPSYAGQ